MHEVSRAPQSATDAPRDIASLGGPGTIAAAAAATRHLRTPGDRNPTAYDFDAHNQLVTRCRYDAHAADRAFGDGDDGSAA